MTHTFISAPALLFSIVLLFQGNCFSCLDNHCPTGLTYRTPYSVFPMLDTFAVGDTLWVEMEFPAELTDESNSLTARFDNYDFRFELGCSKIDSVPVSSYAVDNINVDSIIGVVEPKIYSSFSIYNVVPMFEFGVYKLRVLIRLKKPGLFFLSLSPFNYKYEPFSVPNTGCEAKIWGILTTPEQNNHFMLASSPEYAYSRLTVEQTTGAYVFYVK